ncbi:hypothetical protein OESDEN_23097 [Oesophagostomum dentatum]|uniref:Uncharacterized protein n=1 Tax=Oesophagostomum dentatum TaxID=61180 RepID=A0A0B1RW36_OESDE|nr:hypothetical protein OESDEN_23097 [Oesophagostomum dentatum]
MLLFSNFYDKSNTLDGVPQIASTLASTCANTAVSLSANS